MRYDTPTRRVVTIEGWKITQVKLSDGTWWNIKIVRAPR